jgi:hypothetical protein
LCLTGYNYDEIVNVDEEKFGLKREN